MLARPSWEGLGWARGMVGWGLGGGGIVGCGMVWRAWLRGWVRNWVGGKEQSRGRRGGDEVEVRFEGRRIVC